MPLNDFYETITFMVPSQPGFEFTTPRDAAELDLGRRNISSSV